MRNIIRRLLLFIFDWKKKRDMEAFYKTRSNPWDREETNEQVTAALGLLDNRKFGRCLDVGTGLGHFAGTASKFCGECTALDISNVSLKRARERLGHLPNITFEQGNIRTWEPIEKFDLIILGEVLYYLGDGFMKRGFMETLRKIAGMLNSGGEILLTHHIIPERDESWAERLYIEPLLNLGFELEKKEIYSQHDKRWIHVLLKKKER